MINKSATDVAEAIGLVADGAVPTRIGNANGEPLGVAGLWSAWCDPMGETLHSFTMLTINADQHPLMNQFHKPADEKRMIVILPPDRYDDWRKAPAKESEDFLGACFRTDKMNELRNDADGVRSVGSQNSPVVSQRLNIRAS